MLALGNISIQRKKLARKDGILMPAPPPAAAEAALYTY